MYTLSVSQINLNWNIGEFSFENFQWKMAIAITIYSSDLSFEKVIVIMVCHIWGQCNNISDLTECSI